MIVLLEGPHGVGKTSVLNALASKGHTVIGEHYMDIDTANFDPQGVVCEMRWMSSWCFHVRSHGHTTLVTDRSPLSVAVYTHRCEMFDALCSVAEAAIRETGEAKVIMLTGSADVVYERISKRLREEPQRERYNEKDKQHLLNVLKLYEKLPRDVTIDTSELSVEEVVEKVSTAIEMLVHEKH